MKLFLPLASHHIYSKIGTNWKYIIKKNANFTRMCMRMCVHSCNRIILKFSIFKCMTSKLRRRNIIEIQSVQKTGGNCALHDLHYCNISMFEVFFLLSIQSAWLSNFVSVFFSGFPSFDCKLFCSGQARKSNKQKPSKCNTNNINYILTFISPFCPKK